MALVVSRAFGLSGMIRRLASEVDETFRLDPKDGTPFLVKLAQAGESEEAVSFQTGLLNHLQLAAPGLPVPRLRPTADGTHYVIPEAGPLEGRIIRVISFLPGDPLQIVRSTRPLREQIGRTLAVLGRALHDYDHPAAHRPLVWDVQQLSGLRPLVEAVDPPDRRRILLGEIDRFEDSVAPFAARISQAVTDMKRHGIGLAAFIADSLFSTDGIIPEPAGFLRPVIDAVHAAGGIYIADEVQPGFARTGESMWGFQRHGIVPDLVVMGKPMGNGMPIAGVAARAELLAEFGQKIRYFNTFGGNSISVAAASAVLDVIEDEKLAENSRAVGAALRAAITEATAGCPGVTDIRGAGLYIGVEFTDPQTGGPDGKAALNIVNELRERRVLISATGAHGNVLKIRPPLPFSYRHVDQFADALRGSLASPATHK